FVGWPGLVRRAVVLSRKRLCRGLWLVAGFCSAGGGWLGARGRAVGLGAWLGLFGRGGCLPLPLPLPLPVVLLVVVSSGQFLPGLGCFGARLLVAVGEEVGGLGAYPACWE